MDVTVISLDGTNDPKARAEASHFDRVLATIVKDQLGLDEAIEKVQAGVRARAEADGMDLTRIDKMLANLAADTRETVEYARAVVKTVDEKVDAVSAFMPV